MKLGELEYVIGLRFRAYPPAEELAEAIREAITVVGLTPFGAPVIKEFPTPAGLGGEGDLYYQAIAAPSEVFQMLTESAMLGNTYIWLDEQQQLQYCTRILLASCVPVNQAHLEECLSQRLGPVEARGSFTY